MKQTTTKTATITCFFFHKDYWFQLLHDQICNYVIISAQNVLQRVHKGSFIILYLADRRYDDITLGLSSNCKTSSLSLFVICRSEQYRKVTPQEVVKQQCSAPSVGSVCRQDFIAVACGGGGEIMIGQSRIRLKNICQRFLCCLLLGIEGQRVTVQAARTREHFWI